MEVPTRSRQETVTPLARWIAKHLAAGAPAVARGIGSFGPISAASLAYAALSALESPADPIASLP